MLAKLSAVGLSALIALSSMARAQMPQQEVEPNDDPASATLVTQGSKVSGFLDWEGPRDPDFFVITVAAGEEIWADVDASEFGSRLDADLMLFGPDGTTELARNGMWDGVDAQLRYVATTAGSYYIMVFSEISSPGPHPYTINFFKVSCPEGMVTEPNNSRATAKTVSVPSTTRGESCPAGDADYFKITASAGTKLVIEIDMTGPEQRPYYGNSLPFEGVVRLYAADGTVLAQTSESQKPKRVEYQVTTAGTFYIAAGVSLGGIRYTYTLRISAENDPPPPPPGSTVPESEPNDDAATADVAPAGGKGTGTIEWGHVEDSDFWVVTVAAGAMIHADIDANEFGSPVDPSLRLYAADGTTELAISSAWDGLDPHIAYRATTAGKYFLKVGATYQSGPGPKSYTINFFEIKCPTREETEPNDTPASANTVALGSSTDGVVCPSGSDVNGNIDYFKFMVPAGSELELQVDTVGRERPPLGCACEIVAQLRLLGPNGTTILAATNENEFPKRIRRLITQAGTYYAAVGMFPGGIRYGYTLHVRSLSGPPVDPPGQDIRPEMAVAALLRPGTGLTAEQRAHLDHVGNQNGRYDVGDLRAYLVASGALTANMRALLQRLEVKP